VLYLVCAVSRPADQPRQGRRQTGANPPRINHRRLLHVLLLLVLALIVADGLVGDRGLLAMLRARKQHDALAADIARQRAENARLAEEARRLKDDPTTIEEIARRELGLIRPGEKVFIIKDVPAATDPKAPEDSH
jgi:cell division protein FtsB